MSERRVVLLALIGILSAGAVSPDRSTVRGIRAHAIPLTTVEAGHGFADLRPLKKAIGGARIVSLGEATHGSREIFQLKHRMLEFLASEMGFTIFAIEGSMPEAYRINDYVLDGKGDPARLLRALGAPWDTEEVLAMIRWMRDFNRSGKGRVQFTGFDMQEPLTALNNSYRFIAERDPDYAGTFAEAAGLLASTGATLPGEIGFANGNFPVTGAPGKRIQFSGYIRTEKVENGRGALWLRVGGPGKEALAFDNLEHRGAVGTSDWERYVIDLPVDVTATRVDFGLMLTGNGTAWFDDLDVEFDGRAEVDMEGFDFGFESPAVRGFRVGSGRQYDAGLDAAMAHGGKQSLRITRTTPIWTPSASRPSAVDFAALASRWDDVVGHLTSRRADYRARGAAGRDIDWAIQNARLVRQSIRLSEDVETRDRSMADNVKWIADQNPNARMVLWAHDGHVTKRSDQPMMGGALREMFGDKMLVFGSAFNSGSFQAVPWAGGASRTCTVPPAPAGSLDATLAASGIPLFALDLRKGTPPWFRQPHRSRWIGAYEADDDSASLDIVAPDEFDFILFTEKTTATRATAGSQ